MVKQIQKGNITKPEEVAAAATNGGGEGRGGNGSSGDSPGEGEEEGPLAHDWLLADQVVQRQSSAGRVKVRGGRGRGGGRCRGGQIQVRGGRGGHRAAVAGSRTAAGQCWAGLCGGCMATLSTRCFTNTRRCCLIHNVSLPNMPSHVPPRSPACAAGAVG